MDTRFILNPLVRRRLAHFVRWMRAHHLQLSLGGFVLALLLLLWRMERSSQPLRVRSNAGDKPVVAPLSTHQSSVRAATGRHTALTAEEKRAFAWFDTLGFPDVTERLFVRVATGEWFVHNNDPPENSYEFGFLLEDAGDAFTVFMLDLSTRKFKKTPPNTPERERVGYEDADLEKQAAAFLKERKKEAAEHIMRVGSGLGQRAETFVWARVCASQGLDRLAHDLYTFASTQPNPRTGESEKKTLQQVVASEIAHETMWRAILDFEEPSITRKELLETFEKFVKNFPESEHHARAKETAQLLERMVAEDEAHAKNAKPFEQMTQQERVAELIFQLREQNGQQFCQPGSCDIFADPRGEKSPAYQLVKMGYDAIPQLIEALEDKRFTRSVGYWRGFVFSHHVLRVGDCAQAIIERIANRRFYKRTYTNAAMVKDGKAQSVKAQVKAWWAQFQKKGEKQSLIDGTAAGDDNSPEQADRLVEKYPDVALAAIVRGYNRAKDNWVRESLIRCATHIKGNAPVPFLLRQMKSGPSLGCRVTAAWGLRDRSRPEAVPAMMQEWKKVRDYNDSIEQLIGFLASSGRSEAIQALGTNLRWRDVDVRLEVVEAFGGLNGMDENNWKKNAAVCTAVEDLLAAELDDTERRLGMAMGWGDKSFDDPRICDIVGQILAPHLGKNYNFDKSVPLAKRDLQRLELKNIWRKMRGLPPVSSPPRIVVPRVSDEVMKPLLTQIVNAENDAAQKAIATVEARGLGALPAVKEQLSRLEPKHPARSRLTTLAKRLACTVRSIVLHPQSLPLDRRLSERLNALKGKPLTSKNFVGVMLAVTNHLPSGAGGISLSADRLGDDTGVTITVRLVRAKPPKKGAEKEWSIRESVSVGEGTLLNAGGGSMDYVYGKTSDAYDDLIKEVDKALQASPEEPFQVRASVEVQYQVY